MVEEIQEFCSKTDEEIGIKLNKKVQTINYSDSGSVSVTALDLITKATCSYEADCIVSTVSIGVLRSGRRCRTETAEDISTHHSCLRIQILREGEVGQ